MAKLKDIFPRWLFRERGYGDLELGGSAFAHLAEDVPGATVHTDVDLVVAEDYETFWNGDGTGRAADLAPGLLFLQQLTPGDAILWGKVTGDAAEQRIKINADGSLHRGDGTNPLDLIEKRDVDAEVAFDGLGGADGVPVFRRFPATAYGEQIGADSQFYVRKDDWSGFVGIQSGGGIVDIGNADGNVKLSVSPGNFASFDRPIELLGDGTGIVLHSAGGTKTLRLNAAATDVEVV